MPCPSKWCAAPPCTGTLSGFAEGFAQFGRDDGNAAAGKALDLSRLLHWSLNPQDYSGSVPESYFSFTQMHGLWTLPFLLIGIAILLLRRQEKDIFMLAWLISLYLVLHRDLISKAAFLHRSLSATAHIFAPLTTIGAVYIVSLIKLPSNYSKFLKYGIAAVFVYLALSVNYATASKLINKDTYNPYTIDGFFVTLNEPEFKASQWILENAPAPVNISVLGIPHADNFASATSKKIRWLGAASQHATRFHFFREDQQGTLDSKEWYIMMDYTMVGPMRDQQSADMLQQFEKVNLTNHTLIYNKDDIRVYKHG